MSDLRVAVLGVGVMGADHVARLNTKISGAKVAVVNDYLTEKAHAIAAEIPGCRAVADPLDRPACARRRRDHARRRVGRGLRVAGDAGAGAVVRLSDKAGD